MEDTEEDTFVRLFSLRRSTWAAPTILTSSLPSGWVLVPCRRDPRRLIKICYPFGSSYPTEILISRVIHAVKLFLIQSFAFGVAPASLEFELETAARRSRSGSNLGLIYLHAATPSDYSASA